MRYFLFLVSLVSFSMCIYGDEPGQHDDTKRSQNESSELGFREGKITSLPMLEHVLWGEPYHRSLLSYALKIRHRLNFQNRRDLASDGSKDDRIFSNQYEAELIDIQQRKSLQNLRKRY